MATFQQALKLLPWKLLNTLGLFWLLLLCVKCVCFFPYQKPCELPQWNRFNYCRQQMRRNMVAGRIECACQTESWMELMACLSRLINASYVLESLHFSEPNMLNTLSYVRWHGMEPGTNVLPAYLSVYIHFQLHYLWSSICYCTLLITP